MNGDGFELFVKEGDQVKAGDPLIRLIITKSGRPAIRRLLCL